MKRSFLQNSARRTAFVLAMLLLLGGTPVQAAGNTTACKSQQSSMESRVCPLLLPPGNSVTLSAEYLEMRLGLPAGEIAAKQIIIQSNKFWITWTRRCGGADIRHHPAQ